MPGGLLDQADSGALERAASRFLGRARQSAVRALAAVLLKDGVVQTPEIRFFNFRGAGVAVSYDQGNRAANVDILGGPIASSTTSTISTTGAEKVYDAGVNGVSAPAGWTAPSYNDTVTGWTASITYEGTLLFTTAQLVAKASGNQPDHNQWLYRRSFTLPAGAVTGGTLDVYGDGPLLEAYVNGTRVYSGATIGPIPTVSVSPGLLVAGGTNVLAFLLDNAPGASPNPMQLAYRLDAGTVAAGTDPQYAQTSSLSAYQLRSEKDAASGYAGLDSGTKVPTAELGTGSASSSTWLRGDRSWQTLPSGFSDPMTTIGDIIIRNGSNVTDRLAAGTSGYVLTSNGPAAAPSYQAASGGGSGLYTAYLHYRDQKTSGTAGGTFTNGAWRTRDLNTEVTDTGGNGSVASNQITLAAGTYRVEATAPAFACGRNRLRLQNITDSATLVLGENNYTPGTGGSVATLVGQFTIAATKTIELQHRSELTVSSNGLGVESGWDTEVFATVELWKT